MPGNFTSTITGLEAVTAVLETLGLVSPTVAASSQDRIVKQMWRLATEVGEQLIAEYEWQRLLREHTIVTVPGTQTYPLPADWDSYLVDSQWNRTTRIPAIGALTQQEWQTIKARNLGGTTFAMMFIVRGGFVEFAFAGSTAQTVVLPYRSRGWVLAADNITLRDNLQQDTDTVLLDPVLFKVALKLAWQSAKGFDITGTVLEYNRVYSNAVSADAPARSLSLRQGAGGVLLNRLNVPDTGFG